MRPKLFFLPLLFLPTFHLSAKKEADRSYHTSRLLITTGIPVVVATLSLLGYTLFTAFKQGKERHAHALQREPARDPSEPLQASVASQEPAKPPLLPSPQQAGQPTLPASNTSEKSPPTNIPMRKKKKGKKIPAWRHKVATKPPLSPILESFTSPKTYEQFLQEKATKEQLHSTRRDRRPKHVTPGRKLVKLVEKMTHAIETMDTDAFAMLLKANPTLDVKALVNHAPNLLHVAARRGHIGAIQALLTRQVDVNAVTPEKWTPLHYATHPEVVKCLIQNGAQVNATCKEGCTALHYAACSGNTEVVKELFAHQADIHAVDNRGHTALELAKRRCCTMPIRARNNHRATIAYIEKRRGGACPLSPSICSKYYY